MNTTLELTDEAQELIADKINLVRQCLDDDRTDLLTKYLIISGVMSNCETPDHAAEWAAGVIRDLEGRRK